MKRLVSLAIFSVICVFAVPRAFAQSSHISATTVPTDRLIQASELPPLLASGGSQNAPVVLQVGSRIFYNEAHIRGSIYAGAGSQPSGLALLEKTVASFPKDKFIVLYCGCCPWNRCPNIAPAFDRLRTLGYTNVKVLYIPNNFGDDWVSKGYPTDK
jgi:thiosulfate/3-mercaptopyruvate sulfurtransferase